MSLTYMADGGGKKTEPKRTWTYESSSSGKKTTPAPTPLPANWVNNALGSYQSSGAVGWGDKQPVVNNALGSYQNSDATGWGGLTPINTTGGGGGGGVSTPQPVLNPNTAVLGDPVVTPASAVLPTNNAIASGGNLFNDFALPNRPTLRSGAEMAEHTGMFFDRLELERIMRDAALAKYANLDAEYDMIQGKYYNNMRNNADLLLSSLMRGDRDAVRSGVSNTSNAANQLQMLLGLGKEGATGATELGQERGKLVSQREAELAAIAEKAISQHNTTAQNLATLANSELGHKTVGYSGELAGLLGAWAAKYGSDQAIEAAKINKEATLGAARTQASVASANAGLNTQQTDPLAQEYANLLAYFNSPAAKKDSPEWKAAQQRIAEILKIWQPTTGGGTGTKPTTVYQPPAGSQDWANPMY